MILGRIEKMKALLVSAVILATFSSGASAAGFDPAYTSRDLQIEAQLRIAPRGEALPLVTAYDPARNASDDREIAARPANETEAIATHGAELSGYAPSIDRVVSERD
jgi:hypothetical protein